MYLKSLSSLWYCTSLFQRSVCPNVHSLINYNSIPSACDNNAFFLLFYPFFCIYRCPSRALQKAPHIRRFRICPLLCQQILGQHVSATWRTISPVNSHDTQREDQGIHILLHSFSASVVTGYGTAALHRI